MSLMLKIGHAISKNPKGLKLSEVVANWAQFGLGAFQFHVTPGQNGHNGIKFAQSEINAIRQLIKDKIVYGVVHGKYIYNFCRKDCGYQIDQLVNELEMSDQLCCDVIIHQGKNVPDEHLTRLEAINNYVKHISQALEQTQHLNNKVILENSAKQGNELGYSLKELAYIYDLF